MALHPRRSGLVAILALTLAGLQPVVAGSAHAASGLATPGSLAPNSGTSPDKDPVLSWSAVTGASGYQVELSKTDDFTDSNDQVALPDGGATGTNSLALPQSLVHDNDFWRVRATAKSTNSSWSSAAQVDKAWDDAPSTAGSTPGSVIDTTPANLASYPWRFAWTPMPDASTYEIEFSILPTFPEPGTVQDGKLADDSTTVECLTTATTFTPYTNINLQAVPDNGVDSCDLSQFDLAQTTVYWRVRGIDDTALAQFAPTSELNTLECAGVPDTNDTVDSNTTLSAEGSPKTTYSECSNWSSTNNVPYFTNSGATPATSPGSVTGVTVNCPAGTTSDYACTADPEITWQPTAGITSYAVTIADDASFTNIEHMYRTPFLSLTPRDQLADYTAGAGYHIAVQACTTDGICGTATVVTATKRTPAPNGLATTKVQGGFQLSWNNLANRFGTAVGDPAVGPQDYQVEVAAATDTDFDNPVITENVDAACDASSETCYAAPSTTSPGVDEAFVSPSASGDYIWRVAAVDETGNVLAASNTSSQFTIDNTPPVLTISTKSGVGVEGPLTISSTEALSGASSSTVHVVLAGTSTPVAGTLTSSSAKTWQFTPNSPLVVGGTYKLKLDPTVTDAAGNSGVVGGNGVRVTTKAPDTSKAWGFTGTWKANSASGALSGSYKQSSKGHKATVEVVGTKATLYACKSPSFGSVTVTVGGHSKTVSEHQSYTRCGVAVWSKTLAKGKQTIVVKVAKGKGNIDELTVS